MFDLLLGAGAWLVAGIFSMDHGVMELSEARDVVDEFSKVLGVEPPSLVISGTIHGRNSCYNSLKHRIVAGQELMSDATTVIRVVLAHEMGHVTQRWISFWDILFCGGITIGLGVTIIVAAVHETQNGKVPILVAAGLFAVLFAGAALMERWLETRCLRREFEADAIAVDLCGHEHVLDVLRSVTGGSTEVAKRVARVESTCAAASV